MMLADWLRQERGLSGTKIVCAEGDCGACTVLRRFEAPRKAAEKRSGTIGSGGVRYVPVNSCITRVAQMDGSSLVTVEGISRAGGELSPVQKAMVDRHGSQCGFCTPGFVMALSGLVEKKLCGKGAPSLECQETKNALTGNLCRCTGYQPILDAAAQVDLQKCEKIEGRHFSSAQGAELRKTLRKPVHIEAAEFSFFAPITVGAASAYLKKYPSARVVAGGTDLGVLQNKRKLMLDRLVSLHLIPELYVIEKLKGARARVGARVTLSALREFSVKSVPELARFLDLFASPQIKNVATLAGNVGNASPIAELPPFLLVVGTVITVAGPQGRRRIPIEKFFVGYRKTALRTGEFIVSFEFDLPQKRERLALYKVSQRKDLDISAVNAAFRVSISSKKMAGKATRRIEAIRIAMGGVAATPLRLVKTEAAMLGQDWSPELLHRAIETLHSEMTPMSDLRGSSAFRRVVVENLFRKFFRGCDAETLGVDP